MRQHNLAAGAASWNNNSILQAYSESVSYDANGNILKYLRRGADGSAGPLDMDSLTYQYSRDPGGNLLHNRLDHVRDAVAATNYREDIDNQGAGNYGYDKIGNLVRDNILLVQVPNMNKDHLSF